MDYIIWDERLDGARPRQHMSLNVNEDTKLSDAVRYAVMRAGFNGGKLDRLFLMAHGIEDNGHGGYGLLFCTDDLTQTDSAHAHSAAQEGKQDHSPGVQRGRRCE